MRSFKKYYNIYKAFYDARNAAAALSYDLTNIEYFPNQILKHYCSELNCFYFDVDTISCRRNILICNSLSI